MSSKLPICRTIAMMDAQGRLYKNFIKVEQTSDPTLYRPDGIKCVFRVLREKTRGSEDFELILLIDNHEPFGFHCHDKLPMLHDSRKPIQASNWKEAWIIFDEMVKEFLK